VHNLLRFDGLFISRRSNVLSFRVGLSVTFDVSYGLQIYQAVGGVVLHLVF
jgi:hypothetical protein